jgi:hypothetical protein
MGDPVAWFEWGPEAFARARETDRPLVLDLRASWSHGCRTMDRETYRDPQIAGLLNRDYVPVRVDRERRPDVDERYNLGGWPTTAFLTPGARIIGGTTYVEKKQMAQLLVQLKAGWEANRSKIDEEIDRRDAKIAEALDRELPGLEAVTMEVFRKTLRGIIATFDAAHGGFGQAPKFPFPASLRILLQAFQETEGPDIRQVLVRSLDAVGDKGLFDAEAGGFFHYSTNDLWTLPRFEKLAEDNARLIELYLDAGVVMGSDKYLGKAARSLAWARETLLDPDRGVFRASQAADDDYYAAAPQKRAALSAPPVDPTITTPGTAAMASAFLRASEVYGDPVWAQIALRGLDWALANLLRDGAVAHWHDGAPHHYVLARDPIALAAALLDAHDHAGDAKHLAAARSLMDGLLPRFWSEEEKGILDRALDAPGEGELAKPRRNIQENAQAASNFARLWRKGGAEAHRAAAERILRGFPDFLDGYGHDTSEYAAAADWLVREPAATPPSALKAWSPRRVVTR